MSLWYGQPLCMQKIIVKFNFLGGGAWNIEFDWLCEQQVVWLALALWCMISIWPVTMAACITWLILSFPLTPLFSEKSSAMFFFSFWICCNVVFFYPWKIYGCLDFFIWEAKFCPVGINWSPVSWGWTSGVVWVTHAANLWLERSLCRVCTFYHASLSLQSLHI